MKKSIRIAYLRRKIRQVEAEWPPFLERIAGYTPEQKQLAIHTFQSGLENWRVELQELFSFEISKK